VNEAHSAPSTSIFITMRFERSPFFTSWFSMVSNVRPSVVLAASPTHSAWNTVLPAGHAGCVVTKQSY
jgi:hypothetical protein